MAPGRGQSPVALCARLANVTAEPGSQQSCPALCTFSSTGLETERTVNEHIFTGLKGMADVGQGGPRME